MINTQLNGGTPKASSKSLIDPATSNGLNMSSTSGTATPNKRSREDDPTNEKPRKRRKSINGTNLSLKSVNGVGYSHENGANPPNGSVTVNGTNSGLATEKGADIETSLEKSRKLLPIWPGRDAIVQAVKDTESVVIIGEPGSGKTTQVPQYILDAGVLSAQGVIAITQPRRVAATTIAHRVSIERSSKAHDTNRTFRKASLLGEEVGYAVRFDDCSSENTKIKFFTDGMLLREMLGDPHLRRYEVVVVDEAHERTLRTDMLLANLKRIQKERKKEGKSLKIIVMSASLQAEKFSKYLNGARILYVKGRQHPVKVYYTKEPQADYLDSALRTFFQIHNEKEPGDVLIFLPGQEEIEGLASTIEHYASQQADETLKVLVRPLYSAMPLNKQQDAFLNAPPNTRKCVLATNIAETSVTIPGIRFVIDCGMCNEKRYIAQIKGSGLERLASVEISKSSAVQRAGRAGRDAPGKCFRLYTEESYAKLAPAPLPEIKRCDMAFAMLQQKSLGFDLETMDFMDMPELNAVRASRTVLIFLGALDGSGAITPIGRAMSKLPLEPPLSRALIESKEQGCTKQVIDIVSLLSASSKIFFDVKDGEDSQGRDAALEARSKFFHRSGDHMTLLNVFSAWDDLNGSHRNFNGMNGLQAAGISKSEQKKWCRKQFINERALVEATRIREQIRRACLGIGMDINQSCEGGMNDHEPILKSLFRGLVHNAALKQADGSYKQAQTIVKIHPSSVLCDKKPSAIMYDELVLTSFPYARCVSAFPPSWQMDFSASLRQTLGAA